MPITIGSNIASLKAQRQLGRATDALSSTYERLSSGQRINKASDDAAGLAIASSLNSSARVFGKAIQNVNDGVSALSIAEGAVKELTSVVIRQRELAEQAANGTYSLKQRQALNAEARALTDEYNRITQTTSFNGLDLLGGSSTGIRLQHGFGTSESTLASVGNDMGRAAGAGTFSLIGTIATVLDSRATVSGDFNADGNQDFMGISSNGGNLTTYLGNGDFTFRQAQIQTGTVSAPAGNVLADVGDLNGDGFQDVAFVNLAQSAVNVAFNRGDGTFNAGQSFAVADVIRAFDIGDTNGDGRLDIVTYSQTGISTLVNNGSGGFAAATSQALAYSNPDEQTTDILSDQNGDGILDLVVNNVSGSSIRVHFGNGNGTFATGGTRSIFSASTPNLVEQTLSDLNDDGIDDFIVQNYGTSDKIWVRIANGDGTFRAIQSFAAGSNLSNNRLTIADFNDDGKKDIFAFGFNTGSFHSLLLGNGDGTFQGVQTFATPQVFNSSVASADFNNDGLLDFVNTATSGGSNTEIISLNADPSRRVNTLSYFDLTSVAGARDALINTEKQLLKLSKELGSIGASQSRLSTVVNNLNTRKENYLAAESRIKDTDIAQDSANLIRTQIVQRAAASVLAQANQDPNLALRLLRA